MTSWSRVGETEYRRLDLRAHHYLAGAPVHDVWRVMLPGADRRCTMAEVRAVLYAAATSRPWSLPVRALFGLRRLLGRVFRWDEVRDETAGGSLRGSVREADLRASLVEPGTLDGPFAVVYVHPKEAVSEIRNATVQAYMVWAIEPVPGGHRLYLAVHVLPVSAWSGPYLALIGPFRRWIVYPSLLRRLHQGWCAGVAPA
jgi:hypothetical protein